MRIFTGMPVIGNIPFLLPLPGVGRVDLKFLIAIRASSRKKRFLTLPLVHAFPSASCVPLGSIIGLRRSVPSLSFISVVYIDALGRMRFDVEEIHGLILSLLMIKSFVRRKERSWTLLFVVGFLSSALLFSYGQSVVI